MIIPCLKTLKLHSLFLKKVSLLNSLLIGGLIIITLRTDRKKICLYHLQRPSIVQPVLRILRGTLFSSDQPCKCTCKCTITPISWSFCVQQIPAQCKRGKIVKILGNKQIFCTPCTCTNSHNTHLLLI